MSSTPNYWIKQFCCHNNSFYNTKFNKRKNKVRCGQVWYKGKQHFGDDIDVSTRKHYYRYSHSWMETEDGQIVDWVINDILRNRDKVVWNKKEVEELGFEWKYYVNEDGIRRQLRQLFGSNVKSEDTRRMFGDFWIETDEEKDERLRERDWTAWWWLVLRRCDTTPLFRNKNNWSEEVKKEYDNFLVQKDTFSSKDWDYYKKEGVMSRSSP